MTTTVVTVDFVNPPREGKKKGSIKTKELGYVGVWPDKLSLFEKGKKYEIEWKEQGQYKDFVKMIGQPQAGNGKRDDATPERIFVCGIVNSAVSSGKVEPTVGNLTALTNAAREAWAATFGAQKEEGAPY